MMLEIGKANGSVHGMQIETGNGKRKPPTVPVGNFPTGFRWGCATSSFQIEGATREDGRGESIWDRFCSIPGHVRDSATGDPACDHYHRWEEDLDLAAQLGLNAYRFSIAWPRICPSGYSATLNNAGLDFYDRLIDGMLERGLEPWPTLYHWDLPQTLQDLGGWVNRMTVDAFADYSAIVAKRLGDRVHHWITHNEPWCSAILGHLEGVHAPGIRDMSQAFQACHHILLSHGRAVQSIRAVVPQASVGIVLSLHPVRPVTGERADLEAAERHDALRNRWFLDPLHGRGYPEVVLSHLGSSAPQVLRGDMETIAEPTDFLGVNYYFPEAVGNGPGESPVDTRVVPRPDHEVTASGWEVEPAGMLDVLQRVHRDYAPAALFLTENGASYEDTVEADGSIHDVARRDFIARHVSVLHDAIAAGIPVSGYFVWSLLDNFEWAEGYSRRFGIVHVDFSTQSRRLKDSAVWYRDFLSAKTAAAVA